MSVMATVKGSKQHQMVVVPHRPMYKAMIFMAFLVAMAAFSWLTYQYGKNEGLALKVEIVEEKERIARQLIESQQMISEMRQEIADLQVGGEIDDKANEEVRQTIEQLQEQIAQLNEEVNFYKGVMVPNAADKGLRIERLDVSSNVPGRVKYSLLLTQVVDKHDYVQGAVQISLLGQEGGLERSFNLSELDEQKEASVRFRFRYFQNINGELMVPEGFEPREVMVVAQSSGANVQRLEKTFDWPLGSG
ncbi:MAG: hypothetical protein JJ952_16670 [Pseudomonadales bacterium]|nr:hypothetical protein [Pseudomonadales bacterium]MBO6824215.1 hypothetical protein [Pseudomonadales bacterium]